MAIFESPQKRVWGILTGSWALICLLLATPFSWEMFREDAIFYVIFSYIFLCLASFPPLLHNWVFQQDQYRGWLFIVVSLFASAFLLIASQVRGDEQFTIIISLAWWAIFVTSYFTYFGINPLHALTNFSVSRNGKKQLKGFALGLLSSFIFGWTFIQMPHLLQGELMNGSSPDALDEALFQFGISLAGAFAIFLISIIGSSVQSAIKKSWWLLGGLFFYWALWTGVGAMVFAYIGTKGLEMVAG